MKCSLLATRVVLMSMLTSKGSSMTSTFSKGKRNSCHDGALSFNLTLPSKIFCAYKCHIGKDCKSFNYNEQTEFCVGCRDSCGKNSNSEESTEGQCWYSKGEEYASDCLDLVERFNITDEGVYLIKSDYGSVYNVFCSSLEYAKSFLPEYTVFLRRNNNSLKFNRTFVEYRDGFGEIHGNHWRGLDFLHEMTVSKNTDILFKIEETFHIQTGLIKTGFDVYSSFIVGPGPGYMLSVGVLTSDGSVLHGLKTRSCFTYSNNNNFSTNDRDYSGTSCPSKHGYGGWWWNHDCYSINPTGVYMGAADGASHKCLGYEFTKKLTMAFRRKK